MPIKGRWARAAAGPCRSAQDTRPQGCSASASLTNPPSPLHGPAWDQPAPPAAAGQGGTSPRAWLLPPEAPSLARQGPGMPLGPWVWLCPGSLRVSRCQERGLSGEAAVVLMAGHLLAAVRVPACVSYGLRASCPACWHSPRPCMQPDVKSIHVNAVPADIQPVVCGPARSSVWLCRHLCAHACSCA